MADLSPALHADLAFAVGRYGLSVAEVPLDHTGKSIADRLTMLVDGGESYCRSTFRKTDLRSEHGDIWQLFPENPATAREQNDLIDEVGELLREEETFRQGPSPSLIRHSDLPRAEHVAALEHLVAFIDGTGDAPEVVANWWTDTTLFDEASETVPALRAAEEASRIRELLVAELTSGAVPAASAIYVRKALDSDVDGLHNADITLAGYRVKAAALRDQAELALHALRPHFRVAERIRQVRDDLNRIDDVLHWPGSWRTAPRLPEPVAAG